METVQLTSIARQHADWLSVRQVLIAGNVANANTPGFEGRDVKPFVVQDQGFAQLVTTSPMHVSASPSNVDGVSTGKGSAWETVYSGNNVSIPQESLKLGEVGTAFELNTSVLKSFHRLVLTAYAG